MIKKYIFIILLCRVFFTVAQEGSYSIKNSAINSIYSDFGVAYYGDKAVVLSSARKDMGVKKKRWMGNSQPFLDIYKGDIHYTGEITNLELFSKTLKKKFHISNVTFTKDLKTIYFSGNNFSKKKNLRGLNLIQLYKATMGDNGEWGAIQKMPFCRDDYQTGHPSLNEAEDKLYFISDMNTQNSYGGTDIYVVSIRPNGSYGIPENLGPNVNTPKNEMFPFISTDNILYYSSNGFADTYGGLDIYATKLMKDVGVSKNLGTPINSPKNDHSFIINNNKKTGFFASDREGGKGSDDIYSFVKFNPLVDSAFEIYGVVKDNKSNDLLPGTMVVLYKKIDSVLVGDNAYYNFKNIKGEGHKIISSKADYKSDTRSVSYSNKPKEENIYLNKIDLKAIPYGVVKEVQGNTILSNSNSNTYFNLNSSYLTSKEKTKLDKIVNVLYENPQLNIECASYTSSDGSYKYNMWLSNRRAKRVANYLISKGIPGYRITWKGYGESQILNRCLNGVRCTDAEHRENRRNEFIITNILK